MPTFNRDMKTRGSHMRKIKASVMMPPVLYFPAFCCCAGGRGISAEGDRQVRTRQVRTQRKAGWQMTLESWGEVVHSGGVWWAIALGTGRVGSRFQTHHF